MKRLCVFCGSSVGSSDAYRALAADLGRTLARHGVTTVYGGGHVGLMGVVADAALAEGGEVIGVIPQSLMDRELGHAGLTELHVVESMHARKALMAELSDGFVALPGGLGTLEELFEVWTWAQLGMHAKPCGLLDTGSFYAPLVGFLDHLVTNGFVSAAHRAMLTVTTSPEELLARFARYTPSVTPKWVSPAQS